MVWKYPCQAQVETRITTERGTFSRPAAMSSQSFTVWQLSGVTETWQHASAVPCRLRGMRARVIAVACPPVMNGVVIRCVTRGAWSDARCLSWLVHLPVLRSLSVFNFPSTSNFFVLKIIFIVQSNVQPLFWFIRQGLLANVTLHRLSAIVHRRSFHVLCPV